MNALNRRIKRQKAATRKEREIQAAEHNAIGVATDALIYAMAIVLHDRRGFGAKRLTETFNDINDTINHFSEFYGVDCLTFALKRKCEERGIIFDMDGNERDTK